MQRPWLRSPVRILLRTLTRRAASDVRKCKRKCFCVCVTTSSCTLVVTSWSKSLALSHLMLPRGFSLANKFRRAFVKPSRLSCCIRWRRHSKQDVIGQNLRVLFLFLFSSRRLRHKLRAFVITLLPPLRELPSDVWVSCLSVSGKASFGSPLPHPSP